MNYKSSHKKFTAAVLILLLYVITVTIVISCLSGCVSQTAYKDPQGRWVYNTNEILHQSNSSAQLAGQGSITVREYDRKTGSLSADYQITGTDDNSLITVRSRPDGIAAVRLWGLLNLGSDLINAGNQIGQDATQ